MVNLEVWKNSRSAPKSMLDDVWRGLFDDVESAFFLPVLQRSKNEMQLTPACDVTETKETFVLSFDVPGLKKEDINIEVTGRQLVISGERKKEEELQNGNPHRIERSYGKFSRVFDLPEGVNTEVIHASCENGVLKVSVPKGQSAKTRKIQIIEGDKESIAG